MPDDEKRRYAKGLEHWAGASTAYKTLMHITDCAYRRVGAITKHSKICSFVFPTRKEKPRRR